MQSEFYAKPDPDRRKVDNIPVYVMNGEKALARTPTHVVFNGRYNGMLDKPLAAKPGERVRLFVLNVGPGSTSSFHVVGTVFDRVWLEGNPRNELQGVQTVLLGASGSAIVEFMIPEKGDYIMVDHHFANAALGAIGVISASEGAATTRSDEPPEIQATLDADAAKENAPSKPSAQPAIRWAVATRSVRTCTASPSGAPTSGSRAGCSRRKKCRVPILLQRSSSPSTRCQCPTPD
ncbi:MAG TPA: hypothetical protein VIY30_06435 [Burkholderiaceae bacterium]